MADSNVFVNNSRRRIEALKFLSSITLDGTFCKTASSLKCNGIVPKNFSNSRIKRDNSLELDSSNDENVFLKNDCGIPIVRNNKYIGDGQSVCSESAINTSIKAIVDDGLLTKRIFSHSTKSNKRLITSNGELDRKNNIRSTSTNQKVNHSSTCSDVDHQFSSSCESIYPTTSRFITKPPAHDAIVEVNGERNINVIKSIKDHTFNGERIFMVTKRHVPFLVCSFIPYESSDRSRLDLNKEVVKKRTVTRPRPISIVGDLCNQFEAFGIIKSEDGQEMSYAKLLVPSRSLKEFFEMKRKGDISMDMTNYTFGHHRQLLARTKVLTRKPGYKWCYSYDQATQKGMANSTSPALPAAKDKVYKTSTRVYNPTLLDDPELIAGRHRTLLTFTAYLTSVIDYIRPYDLKKEINDKFKEKFPYIKLTLSKLRSLKREMYKVVRSGGGTELLTVAHAYVYFEKLILRGLINKQNRKLCAAASVLLSAKLNDMKGDALRALIERIENVFRLNRKELFESEFAVLVALEFGLHIPLSDVFPHYQRLMYES